MSPPFDKGCQRWNYQAGGKEEDMEEVKANGELREGWRDRSGCRNRVTWRESTGTLVFI